jgi:hypothetical protein
MRRESPPFFRGGPNGLLLRADIHTLFDLGLIAIDITDMTVVIAPLLEGTTYGKYAGEAQLLAEDAGELPSREALDQHRRGSKTYTL